jgi:hypothetical protein
MPVTMFQIRWLQVFVARLVPIAWVGLLIPLFLIFVASCECPALAFSPMPIENSFLRPERGSVGPCRLPSPRFP